MNHLPPPTRTTGVMAWFLFLLFVDVAGARGGLAADFRTELSSLECDVGETVVLRLVFEDVSDYEKPEIPEIDGLLIRRSGGPMHRSGSFLLNGQVTRSSSITRNYAVTVLRAGEFEIPSFTAILDGEKFSTEPIRLVTSVGETDDLLFVEIESKQERVYVGEALELKLKIWVRPYRDKDRNIVLSESYMWSVLSERSTWGVFASRMDELASGRKRPQGREVLRDDSEGNPRSYYLYEIEATIYLKRPGAIDASDVNVALDYPERLSDRDSRSFFRTQPQVTQSRPIQAAADVDATQVIPVPMQGRPDSYQGAIGNYQISAYTDSKLTRAGDPITLQVAIQGNGPLELIQAPPLGVLDKGFRVDQQPLAGFVQDGSKYFTTTVRPRDSTVTEIPSIEMSFFDPKTETFQSVATQPIEIEVGESETLGLDAIESDSSSEDRSGVANRTDAEAINRFSLTGFLYRNASGAELLQNESPKSLRRTAWLFALVPPLGFVLAGLMVHRVSLTSPSRWLCSRRQLVIADLRTVKTDDAIPEILTAYLRSIRGTPSSNGTSDWLDGLGFLRSKGQSILAAELETLAHDCRRSTPTRDSSIEPLKERAIDWVQRTETVRKSGWRVAAVDRGQSQDSGGFGSGGMGSGVVAARSVIALAVLLSMPQNCFAAETAAATVRPEIVDLTPDQQSTLFAEANAIYADSMRASADGNTDGFAKAAGKYQQIVDSGVDNSGLYLSLGNAHMRAGEIGRGIANYRRAQSIDPTNPLVQFHVLLSQIKAGVPVSQYCLPLVALTVMALGSIFGWGFLSWGIFKKRRSDSRRAFTRLGIGFLIVFGLGVVLLVRDPAMRSTRSAIAVADSISLQPNDGETSETLFSLESVQGHAFEVAGQRGDWVQLITSNTEPGWIHRDQVELVRR